MAKHKFDYDLIVIGSGPGGTTGALLAARAGLRVAIVESDKWGGSALNYTDIPSSALFRAAHLLAEARNAGDQLGFSVGALRYNYPTLNHWKSLVARRAGANSKKLFEEARVTCFHGFAHFLSPYEISVGDNRISAPFFLLATGSTLADTGIKGLESVECLTPKSALSITKPPKTLFVVGAGSTGCELAQYFSILGTKVLLADIAGRLLPREDEEVGQVVDEIFNKSGIKVLTQSRVTFVTGSTSGKRVVFLRGGSEKFVNIDEVLLATGSSPMTDIGLENAGVTYTKTGVTVAPTMQTSVKHIYACGDIISSTSSAEKAAAEAFTAISNIIHKKAKDTVNYSGFTRITNTFPSIAQVGVTEDDCIRRDRKIKKAILPLSVASASNTNSFSDGFVKLITDRTGVLIGATVMAPRATEMISELSFAIRVGATAQDLASSPHPATSWSELIRLTAQHLSR